MKMILCLALLLPVTGMAQTKSDYQHAMANFQRFYNAGQGDSICAMFHLDYRSMGVKPLWSKERTAEALKQFGTLKSFVYIGIDQTDVDTVRVFQTFFSKAGPRTTSLTLHKDYKLGTFRFTTTSDGINNLLKKERQATKDNH